MRNLIFTLFCLIGFSLPVFADTTPDGRPVLYCPDHIDCSFDGKLDSCHMSDNPYGTWRIYTNEGRVTKGTYRLKNVKSSYQIFYPGDNPDPTVCSYSKIDDRGIEKLIRVKIKGVWSSEDYSPNFFEAFLSHISAWSIRGWDAECFSDNPQICPFVELPEIALISLVKGKGYPGRLFYWSETQSAEILSYQMLLNLCGPTTACKINIGEVDGLNFKNNGIVTLNIMRPDIVTVVDLYTSPSSPCTLKKKEPFNTIYCEPNQKSQLK
ncbi:hypothetical protein [Legionella bozemanae]|uniref:hypothetical protein n=1 Tax=Legionella bozemanae TaxID=447 RepID=UPI001040E71E|nr:hypothetical protein [Legionella bozemanae]